MQIPIAKYCTYHTAGIDNLVPEANSPVLCINNNTCIIVNLIKLFNLPVRQCMVNARANKFYSQVSSGSLVLTVGLYLFLYLPGWRTKHYLCGFSLKIFILTETNVLVHKLHHHQLCISQFPDWIFGWSDYTPNIRRWLHQGRYVLPCILTDTRCSPCEEQHGETLERQRK